jgi:MEMO1 family protein
MVLGTSFELVPIVTGNVEPAKVAELLLPYMNDQTAIIASSDLSHYLSSDQAKDSDKVTIQTVLNDKPDGVLDACGETPIRIIMLMAEKLGLHAQLLDARNSYETAPQHGSAGRVVGYASLAFVKKGNSAQPVALKKTDEPDKIPADVQSYLLKLARASLEAAVKGTPQVAPKDVPALVLEKRGCFVTLTENDNLRGCIGYIEGIKPLYLAIIDNAQNAALRDPRFNPVTADELTHITVEVSVLTPPQPLDYSSPQDLLDKLVPGQDGIILQKGYHQSTYLPQVWEQLPDKVKFLEQLSLKGGMDPDGWKSATVKRYRAIHFSE